MNRIKNLVAITAFSLIVLALPATASAQWGGIGRDDDYYGRGGGRYNRNIQATVQNLKNRARNFERATDRYDRRNDDRYDRRGGYGGYGGYGSSDRIEDLADEFSRAAERFENAYGRGRNLGNSEDEARRLLDIGSRIDQVLYNVRANRRLESQWSLIRNDLRVIADVYGYNYNRNNRNRNGNWRNNIPFPLPF